MKAITWDAFKRAWKVWILPLLCCHLFGAVVLNIYSTFAEQLAAANLTHMAEEILVFVLGPPVYGTMAYMMLQYRYVYQLPVRKSVRWCWYVLVGAYVIVAWDLVVKLLLYRLQHQIP
jgi:hypothetical protein